MAQTILDTGLSKHAPMARQYDTSAHPEKESRKTPKTPKMPVQGTYNRRTYDNVPRISLVRILDVENSLALGKEILPVFNTSPQSPLLLLPLPASSLFSQASTPLSPLERHASESKFPPRELTLGFLPPMDRRLFSALWEAELCYSHTKYDIAAGRLHSALQMCSKGFVLNDTLCSDSEDICLVMSYIAARMAVCYLRLRRPEVALNHCHRSIQLNPKHFQNHLRQAAIYRMLGDPSAAAKSALSADWLYCLSGDSEHNISTHLKLYWQAMLEESFSMQEDLSVMYTPYSGEPTAQDISRAENVFRKKHPAFCIFIYTDPAGGHILPQTTNWIAVAPPSAEGSAPAPPPPPPQQYLFTVGFRRGVHRHMARMLHTIIWSPLSERTPGAIPEMEDKNRVLASCDWFRYRVLRILDLMQASQLNSGLYPGSGLMERLQYGSLLAELGHHQEHEAILHRCFSQLATAPYLQEVSPQQTTLLQALLTDITRELGGERNKAARVWSQRLQVAWFEDLMYKLERCYLKKKLRKQKTMFKNKKIQGQRLISTPKRDTQHRSLPSVSK